MLNSKENFGGSGFGRYAHPASKPLSWPERKYHSKALPESTETSESNNDETPKDGENGDKPVAAENEANNE